MIVKIWSLFPKVFTLWPNFLNAITFSPELLIFHFVNLSLNDSIMVDAFPTGWTRTTPRHLNQIRISWIDSINIFYFFWTKLNYSNVLQNYSTTKIESVKWPFFVYQLNCFWIQHRKTCYPKRYKRCLPKKNENLFTFTKKSLVLKGLFNGSSLCVNVKMQNKMSAWYLLWLQTQPDFRENKYPTGFVVK